MVIERQEIKVESRDLNVHEKHISSHGSPIKLSQSLNNKQVNIIDYLIFCRTMHEPNNSSLTPKKRSKNI